MKNSAPPRMQVSKIFDLVMGDLVSKRLNGCFWLRHISEMNIEDINRGDE